MTDWKQTPSPTIEERLSATYGHVEDFRVRIATHHKLTVRTVVAAMVLLAVTLGAAAGPLWANAPMPGAAIIGALMTPLAFAVLMLPVLAWLDWPTYPEPHCTCPRCAETEVRR